MEFNQNQTLTPEKIINLIAEVKREIMLMQEAIKNKQLGSEGYRILLQKQKQLQELLTKLINKRGVLTPAETKSALETLQDSKRARMQKQFRMGMTKATLFLVAFGLIALGTYLYIKKK